MLTHDATILNETNHARHHATQTTQILARQVIFETWDKHCRMTKALNHDEVTEVPTHEFHMQVIVANKETVDSFAIVCMVQNHLTLRPMNWCEIYNLVALKTGGITQTTKSNQ